MLFSDFSVLICGPLKSAAANVTMDTRSMQGVSYNDKIEVMRSLHKLYYNLVVIYLESIQSFSNFQASS